MWNDWNFFGGGRQATLAATYSDVVSSLDAKLTQPYFLAPESTFIVEAIQEQSVYQTYTLNASRFYPREVYHFTPHLVGSFGWRLEYLKFNSLSVSTINAIGGVRRDGILSGPSMALTYNTVENPLNPQRGEVLSLRSDVADRMFGSDYSFWRTLFEARKYVPIGWHTVFASRFRLGFADSFGPIRDLPWSERFYAGGEGSVRGYGLRRIGPLSPSNDPLGGRSLVEGSMELRRPLFWKLNGAAFFDCGQVSVRSFRVPVTTLQCGYGPAVSVDTPVGAMRVDLGFPTRTPRGDSSWQVYFSIGQYF
jgi:outer membrane protein assembly factor BamA